MRCYSIKRYDAPASPGESTASRSHETTPPRPRSDIDIDGWRPRSADVDRAVVFVERSGVLPVLEAALDSTTGRPRFLSVRALLVAMTVNGLKKRHVAHIRDITAALNSLSKHRLHELGCRLDHWPNHLYKRVDDLFNKMCRALCEGIVIDGEHYDDIWFANRIGASPITEDMRMSSSVAVDGTDVETAARLHTGETEVSVDGGAAESQPVGADGKASKKAEERPRARILGLGPDNRNVYTLDPDARGGYRTQTNRRAGGTFVGYEWHLAVQTRDVTWTNGADQITLGPDVPGLIVGHALTPAGSHRADAIVPLLIQQKKAGEPLSDVVCDPGYSLCRPETIFEPLHNAGIHVTYQVASSQKATTSFNDNAFVLNQHLFSEALPRNLRKLPLPPLGSNAERRLAYEEKWNQAARYRYSPHGSTAANGTTRFRDPIDAGRLRSRQIPTTMRKNRSVPLATIPNPDTWTGTVRALPDTLPRWSKYITGTTAHRHAYFGRRQVVESTNGALHGDFLDVNGRYFRVFERHRINILLAFGVAGYNSDRIRSWCSARSYPDPNELAVSESDSPDEPLAMPAEAHPGDSTPAQQEGQKAPPA
jgi:hypothetical protein